MRQKSGKRVMVFGVFDGCDEGHQYFLCEAAKHGDELVVAVARDDATHTLKNKCPLHNLEQRIAAIKALNIATAVVPGDEKQYSWQVLKTYQPDIVVFGHDQEALRRAITDEFHIETQTIDKRQEK